MGQGDLSVTAGVGYPRDGGGRIIAAFKKPMEGVRGIANS
jgi:hypothetical protein